MLQFLKKTWWIILLIILFIFSRSDKYDFRYDPDQVMEKLKMIPGFKDFEQIPNGLAYLQIGQDTTRPNLVFVHGSPGSLWDYGSYLADSALASKANMISIDRLGFGYSQYGHAEGSLGIHADKLKEVLMAIPNKEAVLIGHSFGGPVIAKAAMSYPELINGLIMVAPSISPAHEPSNWWRKIVDFPIFRWFTPPALKTCNQEIIPLKKELELIEEKWLNVMTPITIIQGMEDKLVPKENAAFAKNAMPKNPDVKVVMLENENHFVLWTKKELIKKELIAMLNKVN